jgi:hypothetical protein
LRAFEAAKLFQLVAGLMSEQILDGVKHRARMRLHRNAIFRPQHREIQRRHDGRERGRGRLMAADLQAIGTGPDVIGVVDGPRRQPEHLACQRGQQFKAWAFGRHGGTPGR